MNDLVMVPWINLRGTFLPLNKISHVVNRVDGGEAYRIYFTGGQINYVTLTKDCYAEFCEIMEKVAKTGLITIFRKDEEQ